MAKVAARNIAPAITGEPPSSHKEFGEMAAICMMDAGDNGVLILADHMLPPRKGGVMIPGPEVHAMKLAFEKYFLWKSRQGYVRLPRHDSYCGSWHGDPFGNWMICGPQLRWSLHRGPVARHSASQARIRWQSRTRRVSALAPSTSRIVTRPVQKAAMNTLATIVW
jgi:hypothetical protein